MPQSKETYESPEYKVDEEESVSPMHQIVQLIKTETPFEQQKDMAVGDDIKIIKIDENKWEVIIP